MTGYHGARPHPGTSGSLFPAWDYGAVRVPDGHLYVSAAEHVGRAGRVINPTLS